MVADFLFVSPLEDMAPLTPYMGDGIILMSMRDLFELIFIRAWIRVHEKLLENI